MTGALTIWFGGDGCLDGLVTFVLDLANSNLIVCVCSGSNRTPCNFFLASSASCREANVTKPTGVETIFEEPFLLDGVNLSWDVS